MAIGSAGTPEFREAKARVVHLRNQAVEADSLLPGKATPARWRLEKDQTLARWVGHLVPGGEAITLESARWQTLLLKDLVLNREPWAFGVQHVMARLRERKLLEGNEDKAEAAVRKWLNTLCQTTDYLKSDGVGWRLVRMVETFEQDGFGKPVVYDEDGIPNTKDSTLCVR